MNNTTTGVNLFTIDMVAKLPAISAASLSPDGGTVVYELTESINNDYRSTICLFDLATGTQKILVEGSLPKWSPDGRGVEFTLTRGGATNVWRAPIPPGPMKQITNFTSGEFSSFNWSEDAKTLLVTRGSRTSDIILLKSGKN